MSLPATRPTIYLITKGDAQDSNFDAKRREILETIRLAVESGVSLIQLREKALSARLLFELTVNAASITHGSSTRLLVNDRADIALAANADGVHLTTTSLATAVVRNSFPKGFIIGASTHTEKGALTAAAEGADFAVFGPVFETPDKPAPQGISKLSEVCDKLQPFPVLALGGVDESNVASVLESGAAGFAAIRALNEAESLRSICCRYRNEKATAR